jgi:hypothetical protein
MKTKLLFTFLLLLSLQFATAQTIGLIGEFNGWSDPDVDLTTSDNITYTLDNWTLIADGELKFRQDDAWDTAWGGTSWPSGTGDTTPGGPNIPAIAGTYNVTFNITTGAYDFATVLGNEDFSKNVNIFFINNTLKINGFNGQASIRTYDVFGRLLQNIENTQIQNNFAQDIYLPKNQLSFIVVEGENFRKTLKVIAH